MADNSILFDMQVEIMKRLPVKSLAVFRSVSKAWKSTIDSPVFMTGYTNMHQQHRLLLKYEVDFYMQPGYINYVSIMDNDNDTLSGHEFNTVYDAPSNHSREDPEPVGMSQGLLCLKTEREKVVILNPLFGKSIAIDLPYLGRHVFGFGVRPDNCDPMIVIVDNIALYRNPVWVFTLSSRAWRVARGNLFPKLIDLGFSGSTVVTIDRCIYWKAFDEMDLNLVIAFDMVSEEFSAINLPHSVAHRSDEDHFLVSKIKESVALVEYDDDDVRLPVYGVWMMVEDGVSKSFTKLFTINSAYTSVDFVVLGFRRNGQPIMNCSTSRYYHPESFVVYEPRTGTIKDVGIDGERYSLYASSYTETLLLLDQLDKQHISRPDLKLQKNPS